MLDAKTNTEEIEEYFEDLCQKNVLRNIAQNLTTVWYKTFESLSEYTCTSCNLVVHISPDVDKNCPNPVCSATI
ncbi:MAG: hypothetical protein K8823_835 [Cenarchaeum symbiont of Oopsacas minuta]|nr:hypothetical protein [Cenarchaeum symbiont of Oopsacas minuta]